MWHLEIENIGGIRSGEASLNRGSNIVQASNFQGKTSLLSAIRTVMGTTGEISEPHPLTEGTEKGHVTLETEDQTFETQLKRTDGSSGNVINRSGDTYLTDEQDIICARLFAFLGEDNPVRSAVRNKDEEKLTELLKKPLDIEDIDARIEQLQRQVVKIEEELSKAEDAADQLVSTQEEVTRLQKSLKELRSRRDELEEKVDEDAEQKELRDKLANRKSRLDSKQSELDRLQNQIERKEAKLDRKKAELEDLEIPSEPELKTNLSDKEDRINDLTLKIDLCNDLYRANKAVLDEDEIDLVTEMNRSIAGDTFSCWVCGEESTREAIEERLEQLKNKEKQLRQEKSSLQTEVRDIKEKKKTIRRNRQKEDRLEVEIKEIKFDIQEDNTNVKSVKKEIEEVQAEIEELEYEYEDIKQDEEEYSSELKSIQEKIGGKKGQLERAENKLERLKEEADKRGRLQDEKDEKKEMLEELRGRRKAKMEEIVNHFDTALDDIINRFAPGFDGGRLDKKTVSGDTIKFEIVVAREGRETRLHRLSEGELELVGIVAALAGYRTFNVDERVPCILLDGIGQLAAEHIRNMTEYLEDAAEIVVTTAYPEAGEFQGTTLTPDKWDIVTGRGTPPA